MALARIVHQVGATPRELGASFLVLEDGAIRGTIGGGRLEHEVTKKAKDNFAAGRSFLFHFELTGEVGSNEMLCGGVADVYIEYLTQNNSETCAFFKMLRNVIREGKKGVFFTLLAEGTPSDNTACRAFLSEDGSLHGAIDGFSLDERERGKWLETTKAYTVKLERDGYGLFVEPVAPDDVLYLFGGGHISTCLAPLAKMIGLRLIVADDRPEFCNSERFPQADELIVMPFTEIFDRITVSPSSYLAIITRGHIHDLTVLRSALQHSPAYIGMIGSKSKIAKVYQSLLEEGILQEKLQKVHAPIGLDIGAESPEEIAICIAAELIKVRAGLRKNPRCL